MAPESRGEGTMWRTIAITGAFVLLLAAIAIAAFVYSGAYDIGADAPHARLTLLLIDTTRDRAIRARSASLVVPNLDDPARILEGAGHYAAMCTGCHLAPGMPESELRAGLYPRPPELAKARLDPREAFWTIKHGVKMSGMPAWGATHDDDTVWDMVAFVQRLPQLSPADYEALVAKAPREEEGGDPGMPGMHEPPGP